MRNPNPIQPSTVYLLCEERHTAASIHMYARETAKTNKRKREDEDVRAGAAYTLDADNRDPFGVSWNVDVTGYSREELLSVKGPVSCVGCPGYARWLLLSVD